MHTLGKEGVQIKVLSRRVSIDSFSHIHLNGKIIPVVADLTEVTSLDRLCDGVDTVFHLAGYAHSADANGDSDAAIHRRVTVEGTRALLDRARRAGVKRFVYVSSVKAMGEGSEECIDETVMALPVTEYGRAKFEAEQLVLALGCDRGMHVCVLRLPLVYGPGIKGNLLKMIMAIDSGRFPPLPEVHNKRSMVHVDDVVQALRLAVENPKANGEVYLVTDGRAYSTHEIYVFIRRALGKTELSWTVPLGALRAVAHIGDVIGHIRARPFFFNSIMLNKLLGSVWYSSGKIERDLEFKPTKTLEATLPAIIEEYRKVGRQQN